MNPEPTLKWIESFATLTGSSLVPGVEPNDLDYFALHNDELIAQVSKVFRVDPHWWTEQPSVNDWTDTLCFRLPFKRVKGADCPVELFFARDKYYEVLQTYTKLLKAFCEELPLRMYYAEKPNRVALCEILRRLADGRLIGQAGSEDSGRGLSLEKADKEDPLRNALPEGDRS